MAGLYLVGAWLLVQVAGTVLPMFGAPAQVQMYDFQTRRTRSPYPLLAKESP